MQTLRSVLRFGLRLFVALLCLSLGGLALASPSTSPPPRGSRAAQPNLLGKGAHRSARAALTRWQLNGFRDPAAAPGPVHHETLNERRARSTPEDRWGNTTVHLRRYTPPSQ